MAIDAVLVGTGTTSTASVVTAGGTTTTGSTFVVGFSFDPGATVSSVTDSKSNTYTQIGSVQTTSGGSKCALYRCENGTGGASHTATVNFSANAFSVAWLVEVTGAAAASFDVTAQIDDTSSPFTVTTPTLNQAAECVICLASNDDGSSAVYTSSNTTILGQNNNTASFWTSAISKLVVASTSAVTPSWTLSAGTNLALIVATFKEAGAGSIVPSVGSVLTSGLAPTVDNTTPPPPAPRIVTPVASITFAR